MATISTPALHLPTVFRCIVRFSALLLLLTVLGCSGGGEEQSESVAERNAQSEERVFRFGMFLDSSGLGDRGFMDMQYKGLVRGCAKHGAAFVLEQRADEYDLKTSLASMEALVMKGCKAIFCTSFSMEEAMLVAAARYPDVRFILMDSVLESYPDNVASATFRTGEASYLAGYISASMSKSKVLGVIGGMPVPPVQEFIGGFSAGARAAADNVSVLVKYISVVNPGVIPWNSPNVAASIAGDMNAEQGADVFFPVAGASAIGVYNMIKKHDSYAIGVDSDQDYLAEGRILTSVMKHLDVAVETLIGEIVAGEFYPGNHRYDLSDGGVGLSPMLFTKEVIPPEVLDDVARLKQNIVSGEITVPTAF